MGFRRYIRQKREKEKIGHERVRILEDLQTKYPDHAKRYRDLIERIKRKCRIRGKV